MSIQTLQFPILNPWQIMPKGIGFTDTLKTAIAAVISRKLDAAIWRPPYRLALVEECSDFVFPDRRNNPDDKTTYFSEKFLFDNLPHVEALFNASRKELCSHYPPYAHTMHSRFYYSYKQDRAPQMHCDYIGADNIQGLAALKGQGPRIMSPRELGATEYRKFIGYSSHPIEECPAQLIYQVATGDIIFWRDDLPHCAHPVTRPSDERLIGLIDAKL